MSKRSARMAMESMNGRQKNLKGEKRHNEQKRLDGKRWRLWWRGWMRKKKNNKQKQEERNERKSEEKKDGSTSKSHNKRQK